MISYIFHENWVMHDIALLIVFGLLFLLPFFNFKSLFCLRNLDLLMLVGWAPSALVIFQNVELGILLFYPPLIYFLVRMWYEIRVTRNIKDKNAILEGADAANKTSKKSKLSTIDYRIRRLFDPMLSTIGGGFDKICNTIKQSIGARDLKKELNLNINLLKIIIIGLFVYRVYLVLFTNVIDVGMESADGASLLLKGHSPYNYLFSLETNGAPYEIPHTYGPFTYIFYAPFVLLFPLESEFYSAKFAAIIIDIIVLFGLKYFGDHFKNRGFGTILVYAWVTNPFIVLALKHSTNDALPFALTIWAFAVLLFPKKSGGLLGLAGGAKFFSVFLFPLWTSVYGERKKLVFIVAFIFVNLLAFSVIFLDGFGVQQFISSTITYQSSRAQFGAGGVGASSIWIMYGYYGKLIRTILFALFVVYCMVIYLYPKKKNFYQLIALSASVILGFQLLSTRFSYFYIPWVIGFLFIIILGGFEVEKAHDAYRRLGERAIRDNKPEKAVRYYEKAIELNPRYADAWFDKGSALCDLTRFVEAEECFDKVIELRPDNVEAWFSKGECLEEVGKLFDALACYGKVIKMEPNHLIALDEIKSIKKRLQFKKRIE